MQRDALTDAYTRAALEAQLPRRIAEAQRNGTPLALCMLDLDYFKSINDAYGHAHGDQVLRQLVQRLGSHLRGGDYLVRYGGDEFVLLLPQTTGADALMLAERLRALIVGAPFGDRVPLWLSISIGIAAYPTDAVDAESLFERADQRLYRAKRAGRNQVVGDDAPADQPHAAAHPSRLIERDTAFEQIHRFLNQAPAAGRGVLTIAGLRGAGRTQLLSMATQAASIHGFAVFTLNHEDNAADPSVTASQMPGGSTRATHCRNLNALAEHLRPPLPGTSRLGALIAVDDLDLFTHAAAERVWQTVQSAELPVVALMYTTTASATLETPGANLRDTIHLRPLSPTGVQVWLRELLRSEPPVTFLRTVCEATNGVPARLQQYLTSLIARGRLQPDAMGSWRIADEREAAVSHELVDSVPAARMHNLPHPLTEVVGREQEVEAVRTLLRAHRLVTLVGPGGIGKTRLALEVARASLGDFADGIWFVALDTIADPAFVAPTIAQALGLIEIPGQPIIERLREVLAGQQRLLVLDNFEPVADAAPIVSDLLQSAPQVRALVTSRERLRLYGEYLFPVPPLTLPDLAQLPPVPELALTQAIALFVMRTQAVCPDFQLTERNARLVAELCDRLDGLPLAIELAAARSDEFTIAELRAQIDNALTLLTTGPRDLPPRQQTLRGAIDWSFDRLSPEAQRVLSQLVVFAGGWTLDAATAVIQPPRASDQVKEILSRLVDKHLIRQLSTDDESRYTMLETIRAYGLERLQAAGELDLLRLQHARYYQSLAEIAEPKLRYGAQRAALDQLECEHDNIRAALHWALEHDEVIIAGQLAAAIFRFWAVRSHVSEGRRWLATLCALNDRMPAKTRARLFIGSGVLAWVQGEQDVAATHFREGLRIATEYDVPVAKAMALNNLGLVARQQSKYRAAERYFQESFEHWRDLGEAWGMGNALGNLGRVAELQGDQTRAWELTQQSLHFRREIGDRNGIALDMYTLGLAALDRGDRVEAGRLLEEGLVHARYLNDPRLIGMTLSGLGRLARTERRWPAARQCYLEALHWWQELEYKAGVAEALEGIATAVAATTDPVRAARLFGAAATLRMRVGAPLPPKAEREYQRLLVAARGDVAEVDWSAAWNVGATLALEAALAEARA